MRSTRTQWICVALTWLIGLAALPLLPDPAPIHWNIAGEPDGYGSPLVAALLTPALLTGLTILTPLLPRLDPRGRNYQDFAPTYRLIMSAVALFLLLLHGATLGATLGLPVDLTRVLLAGMGLLFLALGNVLGRVQPNFFVGIRTPWTLADEEVWRRTHRVGGRAMAGAGLLSVLAALALPRELAVISAAALLVTVALFPIVYSYLAFRRRAGNEPQGGGA